MRLEVEVAAAIDGIRAAARKFGLDHTALARHLQKHGRLDDVAAVVVAETGRRQTQEAEIRVRPPRPAARAEQVSAPTPDPVPAPKAPKKPRAIVAVPYRDRFPRIAAITTHTERKAYVAGLLTHGRFGVRTPEHLAQIWSDLGLYEFENLMAEAASESEFRRGPATMRKLMLIGKAERGFNKAFKQGDLKTAAVMLRVWANLEGVTVDTGALATVASLDTWRIAMRALRRHPDAMTDVHAEFAAEDARKRAVLAPPVIDTTDHAAE